MKTQFRQLLEKILFLVCLCATSIAYSERYIPITKILPIRNGVWSCSGTLYFEGSGIETEVELTGTIESKIISQTDIQTIVEWKADALTDSFSFLGTTTNLDVEIYGRFLLNDNGLSWLETRRTVKALNEEDTLISIYDEPMSILPFILTENTYYDYNGFANEGTRLVSGTHHVETSFIFEDDPFFDSQDIDVLAISNSSPWDTFDVSYYFTRNLGFWGISLNFEAYNYFFYLGIYPESANFEYKFEPVFQIIDSMYDFGDDFYYYENIGFVWGGAYPWLYSFQNNDWLYDHTADPDNLWLYSVERGWLWTNYSYLPYFYSSMENSWIEF